MTHKRIWLQAFLFAIIVSGGMARPTAAIAAAPFGCGDLVDCDEPAAGCWAISNTNSWCGNFSGPPGYINCWDGEGQHVYSCDEGHEEQAGVCAFSVGQCAFFLGSSCPYSC